MATVSVLVNTNMTAVISCDTVETLVSGHPRGTKKGSITGLVPYKNVKIQSLYESLIKQGFRRVSTLGSFDCMFYSGYYK